MAGFIVVSVIYFIVISLYSLVVLGCLGRKGKCHDTDRLLALEIFSQYHPHAVVFAHQ